MHIVMVSNFLNHHQLPLCRTFCERPDVKFTFVATVPIEQERLQMGYADMNHAYEFSLCAYDSAEKEQEAKNLCRNCDVLIVGSAPSSYVQGRDLKKKPTFFYSERLFKESAFSWRTIPRWIKYVTRRGLYRNAYLLCASAFAAEDYVKTGNFKNRAYKWGYFPEVKPMGIEGLMQQKSREQQKLLWVGRMIDWKHPEAAIYVAKRLKADGYRFSMEMIGTGEMEQTLRNMVLENELQEYVHLCGAMPPEQVREHMECANVFLFTSDRGEGWGAVLNEAMNSGCAVAAADQIGAVPYLLSDGVNGLIFQDQNWDELYKKVKVLLDNRDCCERYGCAGYQTLAETWNAKEAATRLIALTECLQKGVDAPFIEGPCSKA